MSFKQFGEKLRLYACLIFVFVVIGAYTSYAVNYITGGIELYDTDNDNDIDLAAGGLGADVSSWTGLVGITGGAAVEVDAKSELEAQIADVADFAEADGDVFTGVHDFGGATSIEIVNGAAPTVNAAGEIAIDTDADGNYIDQGWLTYHDGTQQMYVPAFDAIGTPSDNDVVAYDAAADKWVIEAQVGATSPGGSDTYIQYNDGGSFGGITGFIWDDTNLELADDLNFAFGTDANWLIQYDEGVDDQLLFVTANTAAGATTDPMVEFLVGATPTEDQQVFGLAKGTQESNTWLFTVDEDGDGAFAGNLSFGTVTSGTWNGTAIADAYVDNDITVDLASDVDTTGTQIAAALADRASLSDITDSTWILDYWSPVNLDIDTTTDTEVKAKYPISLPGTPSYRNVLRITNNSGSDDKTLTAVFSGILPGGFKADIDSFVFGMVTTDTDTQVTKANIQIYAMNDQAGWAPDDTSKYAGNSYASTVADTWRWISIGGGSIDPIAPLSQVAVVIRATLDNGEMIQVQGPDMMRFVAWRK